MRVLLDECLPRRLGRELNGHVVTTVPQAGWAGVTNGELLKRIAGAYDAFITIDNNLSAQQPTANLSFGVIVLRARSSRLDALKPLVPDILAALAVLKPADIMRIGQD